MQTANDQAIESPWMTQQEAAQYLAVSVDTIARRLVPLVNHARPVKGKIRFQHLRLGGKAPRIRVVRSDVHALLPPPSL